MLFSRAKCYFNQVYVVKTGKSISLLFSKIVTLQVRIPEKIQIIPRYLCSGKRASLSVSGSLTLEAALILSLLIFASVSLILPMKILNTERRIQAALEVVGEDFSKYAYLKQILEDGMESGETATDTFADAFAKGFCERLAAGAAEGYAQASAISNSDTDSIQQITMERSEILQDGEWIDLILDYEIRMPFPVLGLQSVSRTARCRRRAWIGKPGENLTQDEGEKEEEMVYLGKQSTRYHRSRSCHYLTNDLTAVSSTEVDELRNKSGGTYRPCAVCAADGTLGNSVYIMPEGSSYHYSKTCTAIVAYVRMVPISEAEHLGACSYCSR